jgi:hypothetical protein
MQYPDAFDAGEAYFKENVDIKQQLFDLDPSVGRWGHFWKLNV